jgi:hypothetical protein
MLTFQLAGWLFVCLFFAAMITSHRGVARR